SPFSEVFGGTDGDTFALGIAIDPDGDTYLGGFTGATDFPAVNAYQDSLSSSANAFVTRFCADGTLPRTGSCTVGSGTPYSTYLAGPDHAAAAAISINASGTAYITGAVLGNFPTTCNPFQPNYGGSQDAFVSVFTLVTATPTPTPTATAPPTAT